MLVSRRADYGIRAMMDIASACPEGMALTREIAVRQDIPLAFLAKIVARLTQGGLLHAHRGAGGGVALAKPASQISLREILETVDGPITLNRCLRAQPECGLRHVCAVRPVWGEAQRGLCEKLGGVTLADLTQHTHQPRDPASAES